MHGIQLDETLQSRLTAVGSKHVQAEDDRLGNYLSCTMQAGSKGGDKMTPSDQTGLELNLY